jgi:hypothetical protein
LSVIGRNVVMKRGCKKVVLQHVVQFGGNMIAENF